MSFLHFGGSRKKTKAHLSRFLPLAPSLPDARSRSTLQPVPTYLLRSHPLLPFLLLPVAFHSPSPPPLPPSQPLIDLSPPSPPPSLPRFSLPCYPLPPFFAPPAHPRPTWVNFARIALRVSGATWSTAGRWPPAFLARATVTRRRATQRRGAASAGTTRRAITASDAPAASSATPGAAPPTIAGLALAPPELPAS